jgi:hypothetical protein
MTPEERIRMLQQHSQFFGGRGPVLVGNVEPENLEEPSLPGYRPEVPARPSTTQQAAAIIKDRDEAAQNAAMRSRMDSSTDRSAYNRRKQGYQTSAEVGMDRGDDRNAAAVKANQRAVWDNQVSDADPIAPAPALDAMSPSDAAALRKKYEQSGHTQNMTFDDWYAENFSDATPEEVERSATSTPRIQAGRDPLLPVGENSPVAKSRIANNKPLPEGREASQYTPEQRRTMQRNVHSPEVPMTRHGGTFAYNVNGSVSSRAPNPDMLRTAEQIAADPEQGAGSASYIMALAQAYGIDAAQYGDDMDMLKADVFREKERHDRLGTKYDIVDNNMGGFRYTPNSATKEMMARHDDVRRARTIGNRFAGMLSKEQEAELDAAAGDNMNLRLGLQRDRGIAKAVRNNVANRNMAIAANNPRVAQGLYMRSLQEAARSGDPLQIAAVHESFGNERAARDYRNLAGVQSQAAADAVVAENAAKGKQEAPPDNRPLAVRLQGEIDAALANPDSAQRDVALRTVLTKLGYPPDQIDTAVKNIVQSAAGGSVPAEKGGGWLGWLWNSLSDLGNAPPQAWGGAPPIAPNATVGEAMESIRNNPFSVPGAPAQSPIPRR